MVDKWICIRKRIFLCKQGDIFLLEESGSAYFICDESGKAVDIISECLVKEYFIPLSEYREQQMKSILDG